MEEHVQILVEADERFAQIVAEYGMPSFPSRPEGFESMVRTILEQQVSLNSARAVYYKLKEAALELTAENILQLSDEVIRACGITRQKTIYIKALAQAIVHGDVGFERYKTMHPDDVRQELIKVKGIGNWTIDVYLMFSLRSPDILPLGDIGILASIKDLWGLTTMADILELTKTWSPYRTAAAFLLWHYYLEKRGRKFPH
ncbi:DNA-3-methyladenine glycosylase 2 family protein [Flavobacterium sp. J372]|uniref:DNA-3-methyladenine glycosylase family protein n=1 Tax=Flavobacterium sp. J372 TaxID=2898436 RepID=UPI0021507B8B|nr:DNA-3-methyladenine glycosylase 2 family protein [Flavobacterium sp. J372]MCR5863303.1 DNA-3-methyladenine glycosylase 2 family protein [Flavobacterium sp. J372]